jgi:hypothetical protein
MGGEIAYISVKQLFNALTPEAVKANWNLERYMTQYGALAAVTNRFEAHEWSRTLPETICEGMQLICCPEDFRCGLCPDSALQLCESCELPLCRNCLEHMCKQNPCAVPEALANDNWFGYPTELLYTYKVRWIEAAAASPVWTSVINYYLEADRGNLIEEHLHRPEHRTAIRGNVSSFSIPWEEVLAALAPETRRNTSWEKLPHPPHVLQAIVKVNVKGMLYNEAIEWVAGARIRPWVVSALLHHLIDMQHPMCTSHLSAEEAKTAVTQRVTLTYGVDETRPIVDLKQTPSPTVTSIGAHLCRQKSRQAETESVEAEASHSLAQEIAGFGMTTALRNEVSVGIRRQSSAQAAVGVKSEPTISNNQSDSLTMSGKSSSQPVSEVQHLKPSCVKTASPKLVSQLQSEEATHV